MIWSRWKRVYEFEMKRKRLPCLSRKNGYFYLFLESTSSLQYGTTQNICYSNSRLHLTVSFDEQLLQICCYNFLFLFSEGFRGRPSPEGSVYLVADCFKKKTQLYRNERIEGAGTGHLCSLKSINLTFL